MFSDVFIEFCAVVDLRKLTGKTIVNRVALGQLKFKNSSNFCLYFARFLLMASMTALYSFGNSIG